MRSDLRLNLLVLKGQRCLRYRNEIHVHSPIWHGQLKEKQIRPITLIVWVLGRVDKKCQKKGSKKLNFFLQISKCDICFAFFKGFSKIQFLDQIFSFSHKKSQGLFKIFLHTKVFYCPAPYIRHIKKFTKKSFKFLFMKSQKKSLFRVKSSMLSSLFHLLLVTLHTLSCL